MSNNHRGLQRQAHDSAACRHQLQTGMEPASGQTIIAGVSRGLAIAYVAVFPSVVAHLFYNQGLAKIGPAATAQYLNILALLGAPLAIFFLGGKSARLSHRCNNYDCMRNSRIR